MEALEQLIDERSEKAMRGLRENPEFMVQLTAQRDALDSLLEKFPMKKSEKLLPPMTSKRMP